MRTTNLLVPSHDAGFSTAAEEEHLPNEYAHRGRLSQDRITKKPKLTCRNWECGVVMQVEQGHVKARLPPPSANDIKVTGCTGNLVDVFQHSVPVPMQIPGVPFLPPSEEGRSSGTPWFFQG